MSEELLWNFETARQALGMTENALRWRIRTRSIPGIVKIGRGRGKIYFRPDALKNWVKKNTIQPQGGNDYEEE